MRLFLNFLGTVILMGGAFGALWIPQMGPYLALLLVIAWYFLIGHQIVEWFLNCIERDSLGTNFNPVSQFEVAVRRLVKKRKFDEAIVKCREWMRHDRDSAEPHLQISRILADHQDEPQRAINELEISVSRPFPASERVAIALRLAELYDCTGRPEAIEPMFHRVRSLHSNSPEIEKLM